MNISSTHTLFLWNHDTSTAVLSEFQDSLIFLLFQYTLQMNGDNKKTFSQIFETKSLTSDCPNLSSVSRPSQFIKLSFWPMNYYVTVAILAFLHPSRIEWIEWIEWYHSGTENIRAITIQTSFPDDAFGSRLSIE